MLTVGITKLQKIPTANNSDKGPNNKTFVDIEYAMNACTLLVFDNK